MTVKNLLLRKIVYGAFDLVAEKTKQQPLEVFETALQNCMPDMEVKSRRVGGANYQVPVPVRQERRVALSMRWIIQSHVSAQVVPCVKSWLLS